MRENMNFRIFGRLYTNTRERYASRVFVCETIDWVLTSASSAHAADQKDIIE